MKILLTVDRELNDTTFGETSFTDKLLAVKIQEWRKTFASL